MAEIRVNATGALKLYDNDDSHFVGLQAGSISSDVTFTLPTADGSNGQVLTTNGSGTLSFATASSADPSSADGDSLGTASAEWSDLYLADGGIIYFGNDQDVTLTHVADTGLTLKTAATASDSFPTLNIHTGSTDVDDNDYLGKIEFKAPDEGTGTDAITTAAAIYARAEADFSSSVNKTKLVFQTANSGAATDSLTLTGDGRGMSNYTAKIWANYNGNANSLRDSHEISSVTDNGTGDYTFTFSNDLANTNYCVVSGVYNGTSHGDFQDVDAMVNSTGNVRIYIGYVSATNSAMTAHDVLGAQIVIFGDG